MKIGQEGRTGQGSICQYMATQGKARPGGESRNAEGATRQGSARQIKNRRA